MKLAKKGGGWLTSADWLDVALRNALLRDVLLTEPLVISFWILLAKCVAIYLFVNSNIKLLK